MNMLQKSDPLSPLSPISFSYFSHWCNCQAARRSSAPGWLHEYASKVRVRSSISPILLRDVWLRQNLFFLLKNSKRPLTSPTYFWDSSLVAFLRKFVNMMRCREELQIGFQTANKLIQRPILTVNSPKSRGMDLTHPKSRFDIFWDPTHLPL